MVIIRTTFGDIKLELDATKPLGITVANFLDVCPGGVQNDGTIFTA